MQSIFRLSKLLFETFDSRIEWKIPMTSFEYEFIVAENFEEKQKTICKINII